jgi:hypothetical protein
VNNDTNRRIDVFVRDLKLGWTTRVSVDGNGNEVSFGGDSPSISGDGHLAAFQSFANNLVPGDTNGFR